VLNRSHMHGVHGPRSPQPAVRYNFGELHFHALTAFFSVVDPLDIGDAQRLFRTASASVHEAMVCMGQYHRKPLMSEALEELETEEVGAEA
jgi:hypothetical protein